MPCRVDAPVKEKPPVVALPTGGFLMQRSPSVPKVIKEGARAEMLAVRLIEPFAAGFARLVDTHELTGLDRDDTACVGALATDRHVDITNSVPAEVLIGQLLPSEGFRQGKDHPRIEGK